MKNYPPKCDIDGRFIPYSERVKALWWETEVKYNIRKGESDE